MYYEKKTDKVKFSALHFLSGPLLHLHNEVEIIINIGKGALADVYVNSNKYRLNPDEAILIMPGQMHTTDTLSDGLFLLFNFNVEYTPYINKFLLTKRPENPVFNLTETDTKHILYEFWKLHDELRHTEPFNENLIQSSVLGFVNSFMAKLCTKMNFIDSGNDIELFNKIINFINQNYSEQISLLSIAETLNVLPSTVSRVFNSTTGITVPTFIN